MQWNDEAIVLLARAFNESSLIVHLLTREHGVHHGLIRGAKKNAALCQPGNYVAATWKARLEEQLGSYQLEGKKSYSSLVLDDPLKLSALTSVCALINKTLPERDPHEHLFFELQHFLDSLFNATDLDYLKHYIELELLILSDLGYGLDFSECAAGGDINDLTYVSPKTGRAVSTEYGAPYHDKLLTLPDFLKPAASSNSHNESQVIDAIILTDYFFSKHIFIDDRHKMPAARQRFVHRIKSLCLEAKPV